MKKIFILTMITGLLSAFNIETKVDFYVLNISKDITKDIAVFLAPMLGCTIDVKKPSDFTQADIFSAQPFSCSGIFRVKSFDMSTLTPGTKPTSDNMTLLSSQAGSSAPFILQVWFDAEDTTQDLMGVRLNPQIGDASKNPMGLSSNNPIIFPGVWAPFPPNITFSAQEISDANSNTTAIRKKVIDYALSTSPKNIGMAIDFYLRPVKIFYGKPYIFISFFQGPFKNNAPANPPAPSTITNYSTLQSALSGYTWNDLSDPKSINKSRRNLSDYAQTPLPPAGYIDIATLTKQAQDQQTSPTNAPAILQSGSFANITNNLTVNYQIKDMQLPPIIGGGTTNTTTLWGSANTAFNALWGGSKVLTFEPDDQTFPSFTFAFSENYSNIAITRGSVGAQAGTSSPWTINMTPLVSALSSLSLPLPKQWTVDFTIDENWNIIVNALNLECHTFAVVSNAIQETVHNIVLSARSATYSTSVNGVVTSQTVPASLSGGLCGLSILLANNPTCTVSK